MAYNHYDRFAREAREQLPEPGDTPISHLRHTLASHHASQDDGMPISATYNVYGEGVHTGLTWGDLRAILAMLEMLPTGTEAHPQPGGARMHTMQMSGAFSDLLADTMSTYQEVKAPQAVRDAYNNGTIVPRGPHYTRLITASTEVLYAFTEYAEAILDDNDAMFIEPSDAERRGAMKWIKDMRDRGL